MKKAAQVLLASISMLLMLPVNAFEELEFQGIPNAKVTDFGEIFEETQRKRMLEARNYDGNTALHVGAIHNESPEIVILLLDKGADIEARNNNGRTALMLAAKHNPNVEIADALVEENANIEVQDHEGLRALHHAANSGNIAVVESLVKAGAEIDALDENSRTPLIHAAIGLCPELDTFEILVNAGADVNARDNWGYSALDYMEARMEAKIGEECLVGSAVSV